MKEEKVLKMSFGVKEIFLFICLLIFLVLPLSSKAALGNNLRGRILLDVEKNGEAWYVHPDYIQRYYLGRPDDAFEIMRSFGLGIRHDELERYQAIGFPTRLYGRILLDVELHGEAYYIYPVNGLSYYLGRPLDAFNVMRDFGLGITSKNLDTISVNKVISAEVISHQVPFIAQAPFGDWSDLRQHEACEETSVLMAVAWARGEELSPKIALDKIIAMSEWEDTKFGNFIDTSAKDTAERLLCNYLDFTNYQVNYNINIQDIITELRRGNILIVPINGGILANPYFQQPPPARHMILIKGYDESKDQFIVNDPGTRFGNGIRFSQDNMAASLRDYPSGHYEPILEEKTAMIVIWK